MTILVITGTGTEIGKTIVTAAVAATHGTPIATRATTRAASRGLAPLGPGSAPASWLAPKAPMIASGETVWPVATTVPRRSPAIEAW